MCSVCGCSAHDHGHEHEGHSGGHRHHDHGEHDDHGHDHLEHAHAEQDDVEPARVEQPAERSSGSTSSGTWSRNIRLQLDLLEKNQRLAHSNRLWLKRRRITMLNLIGAPGAGKTALLEALVASLRDRARVSVLEGDQATALDAERIERAGCPALQINTGAGCHLDATMIEEGLARLNPEPGSMVFVENVGNLVCPALFDLGERAKVVVMSVTEGEDKPLKYPYVFQVADLFVLNKIDLAGAVGFDTERCIRYARSINPDFAVLAVSARTGEGVSALGEHLLSLALGSSNTALETAP